MQMHVALGPSPANSRANIGLDKRYGNLARAHRTHKHFQQTLKSVLKLKFESNEQLFHFKIWEAL